ncbi:class I lanthipeptide [Aquimarina gracilis]|uniref:Class I lanthipeptide n=1 Tax=Aquimarina gracilis TaxID=874422 RepID=A0ABU6A015_9FLAO|nr:class I lanthipeptide [Aquimarina gracilis]MEB3347473.1 class I lanthipeptide [Aquimarina gracilis]
MKKKKFNRLLILNKEAIAKLNDTTSSLIKGGVVGTSTEPFTECNRSVAPNTCYQGSCPHTCDRDCADGTIFFDCTAGWGCS